jgi:single-strand DNA-binding protein
VNVWAISGRLGHDPRLAATRDGTAVLNLSVAVDQRVKRDGQWVKDVLWVDVTLFGTRAEPLSRMLRKGGLVGAHGRLGLRHYESREGIQKTALELVAEDLEPLADAPGQERYERAPAAAAGQQRDAGAGYQRPAGAGGFGGQHRDAFAAPRGQQDFGARARAEDGAAQYESPPDDDDQIPF